MKSNTWLITDADVMHYHNMEVTKKGGTSTVTDVMSENTAVKSQ